MNTDELEEAIRLSIGMRERDQHDALIDFGDGKITKEKLKALSDESRELFVKDLLRIVASGKRQLVTELLKHEHELSIHSSDGKPEILRFVLVSTLQELLKDT